MNEQWHRVTWLCRSMELVAGKESTNYACACGQSKPVEIHPRPLMDNDPHSNATHKVFFFMSGERGAALLDDILAARALAGLAQRLRLALGVEYDRRVSEDALREFVCDYDATLATGPTAVPLLEGDTLETLRARMDGQR